MDCKWIELVSGEWIKMSEMWRKMTRMLWRKWKETAAEAANIGHKYLLVWISRIRKWENEKTRKRENEKTRKRSRKKRERNSWKVGQWRSPHVTHRRWRNYLRILSAADVRIRNSVAQAGIHHHYVQHIQQHFVFIQW